MRPQPHAPQRILALLAFALVLLTGRPSGAGAAFISGDDSDDLDHCEENSCGMMIGHILRDLYEGCLPLPAGDCILHVGTNAGNARSALLGSGGPFGRQGWNATVNGGPNACLVECNTIACIDTVDFNLYRVLYVASSEDQTPGGLEQAQLIALNGRAGAIQTWVNDNDGRVMAFTEAGMPFAYGWLPNPLTSADFFVDTFNQTPEDAFRTVSPIAPPARTIELQFPGNGANDGNIDHFAYHNYFTGPPGYSGLRVLLEIRDATGLPPAGCAVNRIPDPNSPGLCIYPPVALGCCNCQLSTNAPPNCFAGGPYQSNCTSATIDGASVTDPEDEEITYIWTSDNGNVTVSPANGVIAPGNGTRQVPPAIATLANVAPCNLTATLTLTVTDSANNTSQCIATVHFDDITDPTITAPPGETVECDEVPMAPATVTASDTCDPDPDQTFTEVRTDGTCPDNYTLTRTWTATDHCGNDASDSQAIVVQDTTDPVLSGVEPDITVQCNQVPLAPPVTATDNCDPDPQVAFTQQRIDGNCPDNYTLIRTWTATDRCGNAVSDSQTIVVQDTTAPVFSGMGQNQVVECDAVPLPPTVTASDNCDPNPQVAFTEQRIDGNCPDNYTLIWTWTVTDRCGNSVSGAQTITVQDTTDPVLAPQPADQTIECSDPVPPAPVVNATDNCDPNPQVVFTEQQVPGTCEDNYQIVRTWTATDRCNNASMAMTQTITVHDTTPPIPIAVLLPLPPAGPASPASPGSPGSPSPPNSACSASSSGTFQVVCSATDNCDPDPAEEVVLVVTHHEIPTPGGPCVLVTELVPVDCGDIVQINLVAAPCPAAPPGSAGSPSSPAPPLAPCSAGRPNSAGIVAVCGESVILRVTATDRCGNSATAEVDPTVPPQPPCPTPPLPNGTCCPAIVPPDPAGCPNPCGGL